MTLLKHCIIALLLLSVLLPSALLGQSRAKLCQSDSTYVTQQLDAQSRIVATTTLLEKKILAAQKKATKCGYKVKPKESQLLTDIANQLRTKTLNLFESVASAQCPTPCTSISATQANQELLTHANGLVKIHNAANKKITKLCGKKSKTAIEAKTILTLASSLPPTLNICGATVPAPVTPTPSPTITPTPNPTPTPDSCNASSPDSDGDTTPDCRDECKNDRFKVKAGACGCGTPDTDSDSDTSPDCIDSCDNDPGKVIAGQCGCGSLDTNSDSDPVADCVDTCHLDSNKTVPGACGCGVSDLDSDADGSPNCNDRCVNDPGKVNPGACGCGIIDSDSDNDGVPNCNDSCPSNPAKNTPGACGCGTSDIDTDLDGNPDCTDQCDFDPTKQLVGLCGCGQTETDSDGDGTPNCLDLCPNDDSKLAPGSCGCGNSDADSDADNAPDCIDACPDNNIKVQPGVCGCGSPDTDSDADGTADCNDSCPSDNTKTQSGICGCGISDQDEDGDGTANCNDACKNDPTKVGAGLCGCGVSEADSDADQTPNCIDNCINDPSKVLPGSCGCGVADTDSDSDSAPDCNEDCDTDANKLIPGQCGCGVEDSDTDSDGTANCNDLCSNDQDKVLPGACGCGIADTNSDSDSTPDCLDGCINDSQKLSPGICGCGVTDTDSDSDEMPNCNDACPNDSSKVSPGICGCGNSEVDTDQDSSVDCQDGCDNDPLKSDPGACGCGVSDTDSDSDGKPNCQDACPNDPAKISVGLCGCGVADTDSDSDGSANCTDLCPNDSNKTTTGVCGCGVPDADQDGDSIPDCDDQCPTSSLKSAPGLCGCTVLDTDSDNDGTPDCSDNCPADPNKSSVGLCGCGSADTDSDGDATPNCTDGCPNDGLKQAAGVCGCGNSDSDSDLDGTPNCNDSCPNDPLKLLAGTCGCGEVETDSDNDGSPNCSDLCDDDSSKVNPGQCGCGTAETDTDNDGTPNCQDLCPNDPAKVAIGNCGCGNSEADSDNDNSPNCIDGCINDPLKTAPGSCGCGLSETDSDADGTPNCTDGCTADPLKILAGVCGCGTPDTDGDGDSVFDCEDFCPTDAAKASPGLCGCGSSELNSDEDQTPDCTDSCDLDSEKTLPGQCGCGVADTDSDSDGIANCVDSCPNDPLKTNIGACGCGAIDTDDDGDGAANCNDTCPTDSLKIAPGVCGCGVADTDSDNDATPNCLDGCPSDSQKSAPGVCGCGLTDVDADNDGTPNCNETCPNDAQKLSPGICGCGVSDANDDSDSKANCEEDCDADPGKFDAGQCGCGIQDADNDLDGIADCNDQCPTDINKVIIGICGCGISETDSDGDTIPDCVDGCPTDASKVSAGSCGCGMLETDSDSDGQPNCVDGCPTDSAKTLPGQCGCDVSDTDSDSDGTANCLDSCPSDSSKTTAGVCGCGISDVDSDEDGTANCNDACPDDADKIALGACGCGIADTDTDGDASADCDDLCDNDANKVALGQCGCGVAEIDSDADGVADCLDLCANDATKTVPGSCGCGVADTNSDSDSVPDCIDSCPNDGNKSQPGACGCGTADIDDDNDGTANCNDGCPQHSPKITAGVCGCSVADTDSDNDTTPDCNDQCPSDSNKTIPGVCGCGTVDADSDNDGTANCNDLCPNDAAKIAAGLCGCGESDADSDNDNSPNCTETCDNDALKTNPGQCGCGLSDTDSDSDGTADCNDTCPNDSAKLSPGACGCGQADTDSDNDGVPNCIDLCPDHSIKTSPGICGCSLADANGDGDAVPDCNDGCPLDSNKIVAGVCGCGVVDTDTDGDLTPDCTDDCDLDSNKLVPGACGCGAPDTDTDSDGTADCLDACTNDPLKTSAGICGCGTPDTDTDNDGFVDCIDQCQIDSTRQYPGYCGCNVTCDESPRITSPSNGALFIASSPTIEGIAPANTTVELYDNDVQVTTATTSNLGIWSVPTNVILSIGAHTLKVKTSISAFSPSITITLAANAGGILTPTTNADVYTYNPQICGYAPIGGSASISLNGNIQGTATPNASGNWCYTIPTRLTAGSHIIAGEYRDSSNSIVASDSISINFIPCHTSLFNGGAGTANDPHLVNTCSRLQNVEQCVGSGFSTRHFKMSNDISCSGAGTLAGIDGDFYGTFDGGGFTLENLTLQGTGTNRGLFARVVNGTVKNLILKSIGFSGAATAAQGVVTGEATGATFQNISLRSITFSGATNLGGLVGRATNSTLARIQSASVSITGSSANIGGIIGLDAGGNAITNVGIQGGAISTTGAQAGGVFGNATAASTIVGAVVVNTSVNANGGQVGGVGGYINIASSPAYSVDEVLISSLTSTASSSSNKGALFGRASNLVLSDVDVTSATISGSQNLGGVVGYLEGSLSRFDRVAAKSSISGGNYQGGIVGYMTNGNLNGLSGHVTPSNNNQWWVGGLVGYMSNGQVNDGNARITYTAASGTYAIGGAIGQLAGGAARRLVTSGTISGSGQYVGGVIGQRDSATVDNVVSHMSVNGSSYRSGIIGINTGSYTTLTNLYSWGTMGTGGSFLSNIIGGNSGSISGTGVNWLYNTTNSGRTGCVSTSTFAWCSASTPSLPTVSAPAADAVIANSSPTIQGTAPTSGVNIEAYRNSLISATVPFASAYTIPNTSFGSNGFYGVVIRQAASQPSLPHYFTIQHTAGIQQTVSPGTPVYDLRPNICGSAPALHTVELSINGTPVGQVMVDLEGTWCTTPSVDLSPGSVTVGVKTFDFSGTQISSNDTTSTVASCQPTSFTSGTGSSSNPHIISNCSQVQVINQCLGANFANTHFRLANNINCSAIAAFPPLARTDSFRGRLDGAGFTISNLSIDGGATSSPGGLFGTLHGASIKNLTLSNVTTIGATPSGPTGALASTSSNSSTIDGVRITGSTISGTSNVGGMIGLSTSTTITNSGVTMSTVAASGDHAGGVLGGDTGGTALSNIASESLIVSGANGVGGVVGLLSSGSSITDAVVTNPNITASVSRAGGLLGGGNPGGVVSVTDILVRGGTVTGTTGTSSVGGIIGLGNQTVGTNLKTDGVSISGSVDVGGIVGRCTAVNSRVLSSRAVATVNGTTNVGGVAGQATNGCIVDGSSVQSTITSNGDGSRYGGVVGLADGETAAPVSILNSFSSTQILGTGNRDYCGGLAGEAIGSTSLLDEVVASGSISCNQYNGGAIGFGRGVILSDVLSTTQVQSGSSNPSGGIVGRYEKAGSTTPLINRVRADGAVASSGSPKGGVFGHLETDTQTIINSAEFTSATAQSVCAGNVDPVSGCTLASAPTRPVITSPTNGSAFSTSPSISGTAPANSSVALYDNGLLISIATADGGGNWTIPSGVIVGGGPHLLTAKVGASSHSDLVTISITYTAGIVTSHVNGSITGTARPQICGTAVPLSVITISIDSVVSGTVVAGDDGRWCFTPSSDWSETSHVIGVSYRAPDGTTTNTTTNVTFALCHNSAFGGGTGTSTDPLEVRTCGQLMKMNECTTSRFSTKYFELIQDVDCASTSVVTQSGNFYGKMNGNGFAIKNVVLQGGLASGGLFSDITSAQFENITLQNFSYASPGPSTQGGTLAGTNAGSTITKLRVKGASLVGTQSLGGLFGRSQGTITDVIVSTSTITGTAGNIGGVIGTESGVNTISKIGIDRVTLNGTSNIGGAVGANASHASSLLETVVLNTTINGTTNLGGVYGVRSPGGTVDEGYVRGVTINATGNNVGGVIGDTNSVILSDYDIDALTITGSGASTAYNLGGAVGNINPGYTPQLLRLTASSTINNTVQSSAGGISGVHFGGASANLAARFSSNCVSSCGGIHSFSSGSTTDAFAVTNLHASGSSTGSLGGIIGYLSNGSLLRVGASGSITFGSTAGGIVGSWQPGAGSIDTAISNVSLGAGSFSQRGGIVGTSSGTVTSLRNVGAFGSVGGTGTGLGGVIGTFSTASVPTNARWDTSLTGRTVCAGSPTVSSGCTTGTRGATPVISSPAINSELSNSLPSIQGTATAGETINVYRSGALLASPVADTSGNWQVPSANLTGAGLYGINVKTPTGYYSDIHFFSVYPSTAFLTTPTPGGTLFGARPQVCGLARPMHTVEVALNGTTSGRATANVEGAWCHTLTVDMGSGTSNIGLTVYDLNGDLLGSSNNSVNGGTCQPSGFAGGTGTAADPLLISNCAQLQTLSQCSGAGFALTNYKLTANINCSAISPFPLLARNDSFRGALDGNNFTVSNISLDGGSTSTPGGLFGALSGATIKNIKFNNINVTGASPSGPSGLLASTAVNSTLDGVAILGTSSISGTTDVGGLIGSIGTSSILNSSSTGTTITASGDNAGGLIGRDVGGTTLSRLTASSPTVSGANGVGGLIGIAGSGSSLTDILVTTPSVSASGNRAGGIVGGAATSSTWSVTDALVTAGSVSVNSTSGVHAGGAIGIASPTITTNVWVDGTNVSGSSEVGGLIGSCNGTTARVNASRARTSVVGSASVGGVIGALSNGCLVDGISSFVDITPSGSGSGFGGAVGFADGETGAPVSVLNSFVSVTISGSSAQTSCGGLIGDVRGAGSIVDEGVVSGSISCGSVSGGAIGFGRGTLVSDIYSAASVGTGSANTSGGLIGHYEKAGVVSPLILRVKADGAVTSSGSDQGGVFGVLTTDTQAIVSTAEFTSSTNQMTCAGNVDPVSSCSLISAGQRPIITAPVTGATFTNASPAVSGNSTAGSTVTLFDNGTVLGSVVTDSTGVWTFPSGTVSGIGSHLLTTKTSSSSHSNAVAISINYTGGSLTSHASGSTTSSARPTLCGTAIPRSSVSITIDSVVSGTTTAGDDGRWCFTPAANWTEAAHVIAISYTTQSGVTTTSSSTVTYALCHAVAFGGGIGTSSDPYEVRTCDHLKIMSQCATSRFSTKYFELVGDVDCAGAGSITALGNFYGKINGNGNSLKNVTLQGGVSNSGLFTTLTNAEITNLNLQTFSFSSAAGSGSGTLAGNSSGSTIAKIRLRGSTISGSGYLGGLFGTASSSTIQDIGIVNTTISSSSERVGGIIANLSISNSIDKIGIDRTTITGNLGYVGGIIGYTSGYTSNITNVTVLSSSFSGSTNVGGLYGYYGSSTPSVTDEGYIRNLTLSGDYTGGVVGRGWPGSITDFDIKGLTINCSPGGYCGGVAGSQTLAAGTEVIRRVTAESTITTTGARVGGIIGNMGVPVQECAAKITSNCRYSCGGIAGEQNAGNITDSSALVNFTNTNGYLKGGISGYVGAGSMLRVTASGSITGSTTDYLLGGIIGQFAGTAGTVDTALSNVSILNGSYSIGGIAGGNTLSNAKFSNVYSFGALNGAGTTGGIIGSATSTTTSPTNAVWDPVTTGRTACAGNFSMSGCTSAARATAPLVTSPAANSETINAIPIVSGTADIGSTVRLNRAGVLAASPIADGTTGAWQSPISAFPGIGYYGLTTKYDSGTSSDPQFFSIWYTSGLMTSIPSGGSVTGLHPQFCGIAPPMATVKLYINGNYDAETQSNVEGQWCYNTVANFPLGNVDFGVKTYDLNGDLVSDTLTSVVGN
jgi:hypothetical protein